MKLVIRQCTWVTLSLLTLCFFSSGYAQSTMESRLCSNTGRYVVFAERSLDGTSQPAHEHIFFCNNGRIEDNIGFGQLGRWREDLISDDYALIDTTQYSSDAIRLAIALDVCYTTDDENDFIANNCQDFTDKIKREYQRLNASMQSNLNGRWVGTYACAQGLTGLTLSLLNAINGSVDGIFNLYAVPSNPNVPSGSFRMQGTYDASGNVTLRATDWINQPSGYSTVDLNGVISEDFTTYSGNVLTNGCSTFSLTKE